MTRRTEHRAGAAGEAGVRAFGIAAWLLLSIGCAAAAGCTGPGLDPPMESPGGRAGQGAADGGAAPTLDAGTPGAGIGASGQGGRSGAAGGAAGTGGHPGDEDGGVDPRDAGMADAAMPDAGLPDGGSGDAGTAP